ncbi:hypothetical protein [Devosia sp. SL43]|uniref:hypothetical protein n=1 Tax=Devosia sp. SL43 TaxID=2806348 RepID=UPI001F426348|nr:hypothetical protein [Devosia sp. SL43]UJW86011.1 hypothetical protein IM737_01605 [Devosia sp. SL43]
MNDSIGSTRKNSIGVDDITRHNPEASHAATALCCRTPQPEENSASKAFPRATHRLDMLFAKLQPRPENGADDV